MNTSKEWWKEQICSQFEICEDSFRKSLSIITFLHDNCICYGIMNDYHMHIHFLCNTYKYIHFWCKTFLHIIKY